MNSTEAITAEKVVQFLSRNYQNTLIIDVCQSPQLSIPGSRVFPFLVEQAILTERDKEEVGNDFTNPDCFDEIINSMYDLRIGNTVIVYDETGNEMASDVCHLIREEGKAKNVFYIQGGITKFIHQFPSLTRHTPPSLPNHQLLGSLKGIDLQQLRMTQKRLVDSVWFGKKAETPSEIIPDFLYLSSCHACSQKILDQVGIEHVIRVGWGYTTDAQATFYDFKIEDSSSEPIIDYLDTITEQIEVLRVQGHRVLVHCHAGVSRSPTIILAYLIRFAGMELYHAWNLVYIQRPIIRPNAGFANALLEYERRYKDVNTLSVFWMSESYFYYLDYIEFMYRCAALAS